MPRPSAPRTVLLFALVALASLGTGCGWSSSTWNADQRIDFGARVDHVETETRTVSYTVPASTTEPVRVRNLAGRIELVQGGGDSVELVAEVHARGDTPAHTQHLLDSMVWTSSTDTRGHSEWTLSYPVHEHQRFHYPAESRGFSLTASKAYGREVEVVTAKGPGTPTLFADVVIKYPAGSAVHVRNLAGHVDGGTMDGWLGIDATVGTVTLESFQGELDVDATCGNINVGHAAGRTSLDTGSGDILVDTLDGETELDTGSGNIEVGSLTGQGSLDTGSGAILVRQIESTYLEADTGSGEIIIADGRSDVLDLDTGSGSIEVQGVEFDRLHGDTGSGSIRIETSLAQGGHIHADTGSGSVTIVGSPNASFDLEASTGSGGVYVDYADASLRHDGRRVVGARRGDGSTTIYVDTGSGSCRVRPAG